ncbi:MAG: bifunctional adenosylcobinamide kinase/adenosylcobinamide-phosphate guanylyltransferase, partial [Solirubrobacteraceae bacterium]|nr:bifunctional adenosylcobinamide kinase/adenosylcobinamide-phosphate guanylyltransferase [Solirubrobacteraceae bacterium]
NRAGAFSDDREKARSAWQLASARAGAALDALIEASRSAGSSLVVASEETGLGVVPLGAGTAAWVDLVGELNQRLVKAADLAVVVVAGRALPLTDAAVPLSRPESGPALSVVASATNAALGTVPDDGERRAHPRLLGAGAGRPVRPAGADAPRSRAASGSSDFAALRTHGDTLVREGDADHAVNVVAAGPPAWLTDALAPVLTDGLTRYPDVSPAQDALTRVFVGRPSDEIVVTNGAAEALWLLPAALRPSLVVCLHPLFTEAEAAMRAAGVPVIRVMRDPAGDFAIDPAAVPADADVVLVGNPAAAAGTIAGRETILALRRPGRTIVVDEAFMDLVDGDETSLALERADDLIVVRSFTKSLSVPGVRVGCALAGPRLAARLREVQPPWSVNAFAIAGLIALANHSGELDERARQARAEREHLVSLLTPMQGLTIWPSATNHLLVRVEQGQGPAVLTGLRDRAIAVRPCGSFPGLTDDHFRITARDAAANVRLVDALLAVLGRPGAAS